MQKKEKSAQDEKKELERLVVVAVHKNEGISNKQIFLKAMLNQIAVFEGAVRKECMKGEAKEP